MTTDDARRRSLGELVRRRRMLLGLSIDDAASRAPMGPTTWVRVEQGKRVRGLTLPGVDRVLAWPEGASQDYLEGGGEPRPVGLETEDAEHDATVTTIGRRANPTAAAVGLPSVPPFPQPKNKSQAAVNRYWEALKAIAEGEGNEEPPEERTVRALRRAALDLEEFHESAGGAG